MSIFISVAIIFKGIKLGRVFNLIFWALWFEETQFLDFIVWLRHLKWYHSWEWWNRPNSACVRSTSLHHSKTILFLNGFWGVFRPDHPHPNDSKWFIFLLWSDTHTRVRLFTWDIIVRIEIKWLTRFLRKLWITLVCLSFELPFASQFCFAKSEFYGDFQ